MTHSFLRILMAAGLVSAGLAVCAPLALAQEPPSGPEPSPVVIVGNTRFAPLFERVTLGPGERIERGLDVGHFARVSLLAAAESAPNDGRVAVRTLFAPPVVPVPNGLTLSFGGDRSARGSAVLPVLGPRLIVEVANLSRQPVELSLSVFATK